MKHISKDGAVRQVNTGEVMVEIVDSNEVRGSALLGRAEVGSYIEVGNIRVQVALEFRLPAGYPHRKVDRRKPYTTSV